MTPTLWFGAISIITLVIYHQVPNVSCLVPPSFVKSMDLLTVKENTPVGELVYTLEAHSEAQLEPGTRIAYAIEGTRLFSVDKFTGQVRVAQPIDRETIGDSVSFQVHAAVAQTTSGGQRAPLKGPATQLTITVLILDENDNAPRVERVRVRGSDLDASSFLRPSPQQAAAGASPVVRLNVSEGTPVGSLLVDLVEAIDVDKSSTSPLLAICLDCEPQFEVQSPASPTDQMLNDRLNFSLILAAPLVHVPRNNIRLIQVQLSDGKFNSSILFEINIEDVQNKPPEFICSSSCIVPENTPIDKTVMLVQAVDGDALAQDESSPPRGPNNLGRRLLYELISFNGQPAGGLYDEFKLHPLGGQLQVAGRIDREAYLSQNGLLTLRIRARELIGAPESLLRHDDLYESILERLAAFVDQSPEASSELDLSIIVTDVNDNAPHWLNATEIMSLNMNQSPNWFSGLPNDSDPGRMYHLQIQENSLPGSPITSKQEMFVYDLDHGDNAQFNLSLIDPFNLFDIEPKQVSGFALVTLKLAGQLKSSVQRKLIDYENINERSFIIQLIATETSTKERFSTKAQVNIQVMDANDNPPEFKEPAYQASVREDAPAGKTVILVQACDKDDVSRELHFSLHGRSAHLFEINKLTGQVTVAKCPVNDSSSVSQQTIGTRLSAKQQQVPVGRQCLDYEHQRSHHLMVEVSDGELSAKVPLTILVEDAQDNAPYFTLPVVDLVIEEGDEILEPPVRIEASDLDQSSVLSYSIVEGNFDNLFTINNATGELQLTRPIRIAHDDVLTSSSGPLGDYRQQHQLNKMTLIVQASDGKFTANATVRIDVLDANDNAPKFLRQHYLFEVHEPLSRGQIIGTLRAVDLDRGNNARISYRLARGSFGQFEIDESDGVLSVSQQAKDFDSSRRHNYTLEVVAYDHGLVSKSSSVLATIKLINQSRSWAKFEPQIQRTNVLETTLNNTIIHRMQVALSSLDQHEEVGRSTSLVFEPGPIEALDRNGQPVPSDGERLESMFVVLTSTGDVMVNSALDYDFAAYINLTLYVSSRRPINSSLGLDLQQASEQLSPKSVGYLIINVIDDNTNAPVFAAPWTPQQPELSFQMLEELPAGSILTQLMASDADSRISHFKIEPPNEYFELTSPQSGVLVNKRPIDYDALMSQTFLKPHRQILVPQQANSQTAGLNLQPSNAGNNIIQFNVHVYDSGQPQLSAKAIISVEILPVNDWDCKFEQQLYETRVKENSPIGSFVAQVRAIDFDYGEQHNSVRYQLFGELANLFSIEPRSGLITVSARGAMELDRERLNTSSILLTVVGRDEPQLQSTMTGSSSSGRKSIARSCIASLKIQVEDVNDNPPIFTQKLYELTAYDTDQVEAPLMRLMVRDPDLKQAPNLRAGNPFRILSGNPNNIFNITSSGMLLATKPLSPELIGSGPIELRVQVKQQAASSMLGTGSLNTMPPPTSSLFTDECLVRINFVRINRFGPEWRFEGASKSVAVRENSKAGTFVTQLRCHDRDLEISNNVRGTNKHPRNHPQDSPLQGTQSDSSPIRYYIKENGVNVLETHEFKLDSVSGNLTTKLELDREKKDYYQLVVVCEDNGLPQSLESVTQIHVSILDVDDNKPEFVVPRLSQGSKIALTFSVEEHQGKGLLVGELKAIDRDTESLPMSYCLIEGNEFEEFVLDRYSGALYTNKSLDREKQASYNLLVKAINDDSSCDDHLQNGAPTRTTLQPANSSVSELDEARLSLRNREEKHRSSNDRRQESQQGKQIIWVKVEVQDINDNAPVFRSPIYRAGVHHRSLMNTLVTQVAASDPDSGINGSLSYKISEILMYKTAPNQQNGNSRHNSVQNDQQPPGKPIKLIQYPFRIDQQGNLYTQQLLTQYQLMSMFVLQIECSEQAEPWRTTKTKLEVYIYETSSLLKIRINLHPRLVDAYRPEIEHLLSNATKYKAIINRARSYYATTSNSVQQNNPAVGQKRSPMASGSNYNNQQANLDDDHQQPNFSNIHLIFVDNFRIVNPNLVMEKFDLTSAQLFMPQLLNNNQQQQLQLQTPTQTQNEIQVANSLTLASSSRSLNPNGHQLQVNEVSSLIDKIALASMQTADHKTDGSSALTSIDWLESPSAIYVSLSLMLLFIGFIIFLFGCCCTSRIKDHIIRVAMDKLVKQQTLQAKINEQMLAASNQAQAQQANRCQAQGQDILLQQNAGYMSSFDATKGCIANNNENMNIMQRAMESEDFIEANYTTLNGHVNMGAHFYDASELDEQQQEVNEHQASYLRKDLSGSNGSLGPAGDVIEQLDDQDLNHQSNGHFSGKKSHIVSAFVKNNHPTNVSAISNHNQYPQQQITRQRQQVPD